MPEEDPGPNPLRHNRAIELRRYGLDLAKTILGHSKIETTLIYAEKSNGDNLCFLASGDDEVTAICGDTIRSLSEAME